MVKQWCTFFYPHCRPCSSCRWQKTHLGMKRHWSVKKLGLLTYLMSSYTSLNTLVIVSFISKLAGYLVCHCQVLKTYWLLGMHVHFTWRWHFCKLLVENETYWYWLYTAFIYSCMFMFGTIWLGPKISSKTQERAAWIFLSNVRI